MIKAEKEIHKSLIEKTIEHLKDLGYTDIKADIQGYESPKSFEMQSRRLKLTPDIVSTDPNGKVQYIEVGVKSDYPIIVKSKWKFLNTLAELKNRGFRIISHRGHYSFTDNLIDDLALKQAAVKL